MTKRAYNFYAGPATMALPVIERAKKELLDFQGTGMSIMEISHRSKEYDKVHHDAMDLVTELMGLPSDYKVMWLQGGASSQFYQVPLNLQLPGKPMEYVNTGVWSQNAIAEAKLYGNVRVVASSEDKTFSYIPKVLNFGDDAAFVHISGNNTIYGTEWSEEPKVPSGVPLVSDMSSNLMNKVIDPKKYGVMYAGAQKNLGPAGVTLVIVREDLLGRVPENAPTMLKWSTHAAKDSMYNTPPVLAIYLCNLSLEYIKEIGGVPELEKRNKEKAKILYDVIDGSGGFFKGHAEKDSRSLMNVTFNLKDKDLESKAVEEGLARGLVGLKGHRSVGGMRASIYNAMPIDGVRALADFLKEFQEKNE